jgi:glyoxylase-like metal-dependent hydrolase (beta-lactamase superfamily II)
MACGLTALWSRGEFSMGAEIRLYLCEGGSIELPLRNFRAGEGLAGETVTIPVPWYLLTHPRGNVVIDGGNAAEVAVDPLAHLGVIAESSIVTMTHDQAVLPTLQRLGIEPASIRWVVQSHLHFDHTGALASIKAFSNAQVIVTRTEYEWAHAPDSLAEALYCKSDYVKPGIDWALLERTDDGYDMFGDGVLRCWRTPGHTPGHQSFEIHLASGTAFLLTADAANTLDHLNERAMSAFLVSASDTLASVRKIRRLAWRAQATAVAGHDAMQWATFKHAPNFHD